MNKASSAWKNWGRDEKRDLDITRKGSNVSKRGVDEDSWRRGMHAEGEKMCEAELWLKVGRSRAGRPGAG